MPKEMCPESPLPSSVSFPGGHKPETPCLVYLGNVRGRCSSAKELHGGAARFSADHVQERGLRLRLRDVVISMYGNVSAKFQETN